MKRLILSSLILFCTTTIQAQKVADSIIISIDTINIYGKVVDINSMPIANALIITQSLDKNAKPISAQADEKGEFKLNGIKPNEYLAVFGREDFVEFRNLSSRYLYITLAPKISVNLNTTTNHKEPDLMITSKRIENKDKYTFRMFSRSFGFDEDIYHSPPTYPGGIDKLYDYLKKNINYPAPAIKNNIEGDVVIEFTIDKNGMPQNFLITRDIGYGCAQEVIKVIKNAKKWNVAFELGKPVPQRAIITIPFKLIDV